MMILPQNVYLEMMDVHMLLNVSKIINKSATPVTGENMNSIPDETSFYKSFDFIPFSA